MATEGAADVAKDMNVATLVEHQHERVACRGPGALTFE
jgi:hypothetical protein